MPRQLEARCEGGWQAYHDESGHKTVSTLNGLTRLGYYIVVFMQAGNYSERLRARRAVWLSRNLTAG
jgi:hypothetical protein